MQQPASSVAVDRTQTLREQVKCTGARRQVRLRGSLHLQQQAQQKKRDAFGGLWEVHGCCSLSFFFGPADPDPPLSASPLCSWLSSRLSPWIWLNRIAIARPCGRHARRPGPEHEGAWLAPVPAIRFVIVRSICSGRSRCCDRHAVIIERERVRGVRKAVRRRGNVVHR